MQLIREGMWYRFMKGCFYNWHKLSAANIQNDKSPLIWAFNYFKIFAKWFFLINKGLN